MTKVHEVEAWVDGSSSGNSTGPGGYGILLICGRHRREMRGGEAVTTNQRQEVIAACAALEAVAPGCSVTVYSDSAYLVNCQNQRWIDGWRKRGWRTSAKKPVKNRDLWERLESAVSRHERVRFVHVAGHAGIEHNERAHELATLAKREVA